MSLGSCEEDANGQSKFVDHFDMVSRNDDQGKSGGLEFSRLVLRIVFLTRNDAGEKMEFL